MGLSVIYLSKYNQFLVFKSILHNIFLSVLFKYLRLCQWFLFVTRYDNGDQDNFSQARLLYQRVLSAGEKDRLSTNIATDLVRATDFIQERAIGNFTQVDEGLGEQVRAKVNSLSQRIVEI